MAAHQASSLQAVHQPDDAVMLQQQLGGETPDRGVRRLARGPQGQKQMVLARLQTDRARGALAAGKEHADPKSKGGERLPRNIPRAPLGRSDGPPHGAEEDAGEEDAADVESFRRASAAMTIEARNPVASVP